MCTTDRHDELVALLTEIRDRLLAPEGVNAVEDGPTDITEEPQEAESRVADVSGDVWWKTYAGCWHRDGEGDAECSTWAQLRNGYAPLRATTDEDRKRVGLPDEPAPADEDPDEALAVVIDELVDDHGSTSEWADNEYITRSTALAIARAAREHLNPDGIDWESTLSGVVQDRDAAIDRAEKAEDKVQRLEASVAAWKSEVVKSARRQAVAMAERDEFNGFWKDALADVRKARDERDGWKAKHEALREDVEACRNACQIEDILDRDDERAAAIEAGESDAEC